MRGKREREVRKVGRREERGEKGGGEGGGRGGRREEQEDIRVALNILNAKYLLSPLVSKVNKSSTPNLLPVRRGS